jgi:hypothetical protein
MIGSVVNRIDHEQNPVPEKTEHLRARHPIEEIFKAVAQLSPKTDEQRWLQSQALQTIVDLAKKRILLFEQDTASIPPPLLAILIFWLFFIFVGFSLFASRNATVAAAMFCCALSVSGAIFLILELDRPFRGWIRISTAPLREVLVLLGG